MPAAVIVLGRLKRLFDGRVLAIGVGALVLLSCYSFCLVAMRNM